MVTNSQDKDSTSFCKKEQKNFYFIRRKFTSNLDPGRKIFWFFFAKKNTFLLQCLVLADPLFGGTLSPWSDAALVHAHAKFDSHGPARYGSAAKTTGEINAGGP